MHVPWLYILNAQLKDQPHILKIRVSEEKNSSSEGHACRIAYFGVNGNGFIDHGVAAPVSRARGVAATVAADFRHSRDGGIGCGSGSLHRPRA